MNIPIPLFVFFVVTAFVLGMLSGRESCQPQEESKRS